MPWLVLVARNTTPRGRHQVLNDKPYIWGFINLKLSFSPNTLTARTLALHFMFHLETAFRKTIKVSTPSSIYPALKLLKCQHHPAFILPWEGAERFRYT